MDEELFECQVSLKKRQGGHRRASTCSATSHTSPRQTENHGLRRLSDQVQLVRARSRNRAVPMVTSTPLPVSKSRTEGTKAPVTCAVVDSPTPAPQAAPVARLEEPQAPTNRHVMKVKAMKTSTPVKAPGTGVGMAVLENVPTRQTSSELNLNQAEVVVAVDRKSRGGKRRAGSGERKLRKGLQFSTPKPKVFRKTRPVASKKRKVSHDLVMADDRFKSVEKQAQVAAYIQCVSDYKEQENFEHDATAEAEEGNLKDSIAGLPDSQHPDSLQLDSQADEMSDDSDSSEDLPVGLTPVKYEKKPFAVSDVVWVKWKSWVHLPAMITHVYKQKKRVTCIMFSPNKERLRLSYSNKKVVPFLNPKKDEFVKTGEKADDPEQRGYFKKCMDIVQDFYAKKALERLGGNDISFFGEGLPPLEDDTSEEAESVSDEIKKDVIMLSSGESEEGFMDEEQQLSKKGRFSVENRRKKAQKITDFITSERCKVRLFDIKNGNVKSELHHKFVTGSIRERAKLKHKGFGPIDDDDQIESVLMTYRNWMDEINTNPCFPTVHYIFDVWVPEAIVFALKQLHGYTYKRCWAMFYSGVRWTKEELRLTHKALIRSARRDELERERNEMDYL